MKKYVSIIMLLCLICTFTAGCSKNAASTNGDDGKVTQEDSKPLAEDDGKTTQSDSKSAVGDSIDLTAMSSTMVYAEVYNMMASPDDYMGKTIKMSGPYSVSFYDETGRYYHYVIIEDATACCQSGLEFIWNGDHAYPNDYPEEQTKIEVVGVFGSYEELGETYYYLAVDDILILK